MLNSKNAIQIIPFYQELLNEFESLLPDESFAYARADLAKHEGDILPYVQSLCMLGKALERALVSPEILEIPETLTRHEGSNLPELFYGLFQALFFESGLRRYDAEDRNDPCAANSAVYLLCLRQYLLAFSKAEDISCVVSEEDEVNSFVNRVTSPGQPCALDPALASVVRRILRIVLMEDDQEGLLNARIEQWATIPWGRHGPGAVSEGERGAEKWLFRHYSGLIRELYEYHPGIPVASVPRASSLDDDGSVPPARLAIVPKDFRGHRLICVEPKEQQFAQQGLMKTLYDVVHSHPLTRRSIDFADQQKSFRMSRDHRFATIDLKDASDSLKLEVLRVLLPSRFYRLVSQLRSTFIQLPDGDLIRPRTMFTMGNALCFPIETLVFWAVSLATMIVNDSTALADLRAFERGDLYGVEASATRRRSFLNSFRLRVFGDDIIVPRRWCDDVQESLTRIGCTVNRAKTCSNSLVRESCGSWYYCGIDVRIVKFHYHKLSDTRAWVSLLASVRELQSCGFTSTALALLRNLAEMHPVPYGMLGLPGHVSIEDGYRWNEELQRLEFRMPVISDNDGLENLPGYAALYATFTQQATRAVSLGVQEWIKWEWTEVR